MTTANTNSRGHCLCLLSFLILSGCAADPWSRADLNREAAYLTLTTIDYAQTMHIAKNCPDSYTEQNSILGRCPSPSRVRSHFAFTSFLHIFAVHFMPASWRETFQWTGIAVEGGIIIHNNSIGISTDF